MKRRPTTTDWADADQAPAGVPSTTIVLRRLFAGRGVDGKALSDQVRKALS